MAWSHGRAATNANPAKSMSGINGANQFAGSLLRFPEKDIVYGGDRS
jgi:hypothetical protein